MKPNKYKLILLVWMAMFPFSTLLQYGLAKFSFTAHWPLVARTGCVTGLVVPYMVFGVFPLINRYCLSWLQTKMARGSGKESAYRTVPFGQPISYSPKPTPSEAQPVIATNGISL